VSELYFGPMLSKVFLLDKTILFYQYQVGFSLTLNTFYDILDFSIDMDKCYFIHWFSFLWYIRFFSWYG